MTEEQMLLKAVCAEPEEDGPRLAYADWLQENGNYERAEYIQRSIAQHYRDCIADPTYNDEQYWLCQQVDKFGLDWVPDNILMDTWPADIFRGSIYLGRPQPNANPILCYSRGFVSDIYCSCFDWNLYGNEITEVMPIRNVFFRRSKLIFGTYRNRDWSEVEVRSWKGYASWLYSNWPKVTFRKDKAKDSYHYIPNPNVAIA